MAASKIAVLDPIACCTPVRVDVLAQAQAELMGAPCAAGRVCRRAYYRAQRPAASGPNLTAHRFARPTVVAPARWSGASRARVISREPHGTGACWSWSGLR
ncbi:MAG: hypothetical protein ABI894_14205, partial [Ilumatobacteraceae bacterium]